MPTVLHVGGYRFFFYSDERNEPPHVHVEASERRARFWLTPVESSWNDGFRSGELREIERILRLNLRFVLGEWDEHFRV